MDKMLFGDKKPYTRGKNAIWGTKWQFHRTNRPQAQGQKGHFGG